MGNPNRLRRLQHVVFKLLFTLLVILLAGLSPAVQAQDQPKNATAKPQDPAVAIVGNHVIRESDVQRATQSLTLGDQIDVRSRRARFIDSLVREELLFQFALERMRRDPAARSRIKSAIVGELIEHDVRSRANVGEAEARAYYETTKTNLGGEHVQLRDIQFASEQVCRTQFTKIHTLDDFTRVARSHHVIRDLAETGGEVGFVMTRHVAFGYGDKLDGLEENKAHLLNHEGKCHIVWISEREIRPVPTFDELRDRLIAGLRAGAEAERLNELIKQAEARIGVTRLTKTEEQETQAEADAEKPATAARANNEGNTVSSNNATQPSEEQPATAFTSVKPGSWELTSHKREKITHASLEGRPAVMSFGFTFCPDICPTTLVEMTNWIESLGAKAGTASWSFVSIDPERDTPEVLKDYVSNFADNIVGLTGSPAQLASLVKKYDITVRRVATDDGDYTMDHSASVLLLDKNGNVFDTISYGTDAKAAVKQLNRLLDTQGLAKSN